MGASRAAASRERVRIFEFTARDGIKLHVRIDGAGTPLLLLHEFASARHCFERFRSRLDGYLRLELFGRGYAPSAVPEDEGAFSQDAAVDDCLDLLDALAISRAHVLGVSMGAATALLMALRHPSRVASAVLIGAGGGALPHLRAAWAANMERMALRFESEHPRDVAQAFLDGPSRRALKSQDPVLFEEIADDLGSRSGRVSSALLRNVILRRPMLTELARELRECPTPMLVVSGSEDAHAVTAGEYLASGLRKHIVVAGAGHTPQIEQPERVALEVREFFRGVLAEDPE